MDTKNKVRGAIIGVAVGDALGMPVEALLPCTIKQNFGWISKYHRASKKSKYFRKLKCGQWTDDTQLTLAIGESIVDHKGVNYKDIASRHGKIFSNGKRGWGKATKAATQKILDGYEWWASGEKYAAGNGPPMKIAPVGILYGLDAISKVDLISICANISYMTHKDKRAVIGAITQAYMVGYAIKNTITHVRNQLTFIKDFIVSLNGEVYND